MFHIRRFFRWLTLSGSPSVEATVPVSVMIQMLEAQKEAMLAAMEQMKPAQFPMLPTAQLYRSEEDEDRLAIDGFVPEDKAAQSMEQFLETLGLDPNIDIDEY